MPEILWRHYAGNKVAPLRRQFTGSITPEMKWLLNAESSQLLVSGKSEPRKPNVGAACKG
jgi:hypothetical protein